MLPTRRWLACHAPALLPALALLLTLPALATGLQFDDYVQRDLLLAHPGVAGLGPATGALFTFLDGNPANTLLRVERGELAWWTLPSAKIAFWRPLSSLTHWLDYQLWPRRPALMHLHSLLWLAALVALATRLYRHLMGPALGAGLAAALYALDDAHGFAAAWLANRNALAAACFALLAILAHVRWREGAGRRHAWLALLWLGCGLLAAEAAVATFAYLAAYALWLDHGTRRDRLFSLAPALLLVLLWRLCYRALGYGAWGTSYLDPLTEPWRFLQALLWRGPLLLLGQWAPLPAEVTPFLAPPATGLLWLAALALLGALAWAFAPVLRADKRARFWATGMLLAVVPSCAALPANRLLALVGIGAAGLLARFLEWHGVWQLFSAARPSDLAAAGRRLVGRVLLGVHLILAPLLLPLAAFSPALLGGVEPALATLPADPGVRRRDLVIIAAPSVFSLSAIGSVRALADQPAPARSLLLASGLGGVQLERPNPFTLVVRPAGGYLLGFESVFRAPWHPLARGERVQLPHVTAQVIDITMDERPAAVAFRFPTVLEHADRQWFVWRRGAYLPFALPPVGGEVKVLP